jgi:hypothetical protein
MDNSFQNIANEEHPMYRIVDWKYEVANGDTLRGYREWVDAQIESDSEEVCKGFAYAPRISADIKEMSEEKQRHNLLYFRGLVAEKEYQNFNFGEFQVEDYGPWQCESFDGDLTRVVYFDNGEDRSTIKGIFTVRFEENSDIVRDAFCTVDGNEIIPS